MGTDFNRAVSSFCDPRASRDDSAGIIKQICASAAFQHVCTKEPDFFLTTQKLKIKPVSFLNKDIGEILRKIKQPEFSAAVRGNQSAYIFSWFS